MSSDPVSDFFLDNPQKLFDPFDDLAWLREHRPVHKHEPIGQWFVFPYAEVRSLFGDKRLSADRIAGFAEVSPGVRS
jgi:cytochrome P450